MRCLHDPISTALLSTLGLGYVAYWYAPFTFGSAACGMLMKGRYYRRRGRDRWK